MSHSSILSKFALTFYFKLNFEIQTKWANVFKWNFEKVLKCITNLEFLCIFFGNLRTQLKWVNFSFWEIGYQFSWSSDIEKVKIGLFHFADCILGGSRDKVLVKKSNVVAIISTLLNSFSFFSFIPLFFLNTFSP